MPARRIVAIDVAILVSDAAGERAKAINLALAGDRADALRFDGTHLPHITLAQQFIERARLDDLRDELDRLLRHEAPLLLGSPGLDSDHGTIFLAIDPHPDLQRVHEAVMDAIEPFEAPTGGGDAFRRNGEAIRSQDVDWVRTYRERSAYGHFRPHITVGHGVLPESVPPIDFRADRIAVCELGRFCTCRTVLAEWRLTGS
ncbi:MAG: 2'-5' RNA ligase family protein [Bacteroidales bacterium]